MALAGRSSHRGGGRRWLLVGLVITLLVLLVDASIKSRSPTPGRQLAAQAWVDAALSIVDQSNVQGADLAGFRNAPTSQLTAGKVTADLDAMTTGSRDAYARLVALREPQLLQSSVALLQTCLLLRSQASAAISAAVEASLRGRDGASSTASARRFATAVQQLQVADQAYALFARGLPSSLGVTAPTSAWVADTGLYSATELQVFLSALQSRISLTPVHMLSIVSVGTTPTPIRTTGANQSVEVLSPSPILTVAAVIANTGNQTERNLTVTASISRSTGTSTVSRSVSLLAGATMTVILASLTPPLGPTVLLTVTVTPPTGSAAGPLMRTIQFEMPAPTSATTTTAGGTTTTTTPGQAPGTSTPGNTTPGSTPPST